jgi:EEF1A N-terminal glycine/lysine methyltransferase
MASIGHLLATSHGSTAFLLSEGKSKEEREPEDILSESLGFLFDWKPINTGSAGSAFTYCYDGSQTAGQYASTTIALHTPDTLAANWSLHASAIWVSALYLAGHISQLEIPSHPHYEGSRPLRVLELGASAGLPGILTAKLFPDVFVTVSDYPDERLIKTLASNVDLNDVECNCRAIPYAWGSEVSNLLDGTPGFDIVLAADTLWNPDLHNLLVDTLTKTLRRCPHSRVHLIAGLHTGRYTIQSFLREAEAQGLAIERTAEYETEEGSAREWDAQREGDDDAERRRWVVWSVLKWDLRGGFDEGNQLCC